ncbi:MAG: hypothetical protein ACFFB2_11245 [Promethearchaeota archaeon]
MIFTSEIISAEEDQQFVEDRGLPFYMVHFTDMKTIAGIFLEG